MIYKGKIPLSQIMDKLKPLLQNGTLQITDHGRMRAQMSPSWNTPWIHVKHAETKRCWLWNDVFYRQFGLIHSGCQGCWKVCVRLKTLKQLVQLLELQKILDLPSKCGIEVRSHVHGLYGGYFYNDSLEEGKECYKTVKTAIYQAIDDPESVKIVLKRACTEFEHEQGDSSKWEMQSDQKEIEEIVESLVEDGSGTRNGQPDFVQAMVMKTWIEWAFQNGDPTYAEFAEGGQPLYPDYVTYNDDCDKEIKKDINKILKERSEVK